MLKEKIDEEISQHSHKKFLVSCDLQISEHCKKEWKLEYRKILKFSIKHDGKNICLQCLRKRDFSGRKNPNMKYETLDDNFFATIDTEFKAYFLGWIASDGSIRKNGATCIAVHEKDKEILYKLRDGFCKDLKIKIVKKDKTMRSLTINSKKIASDICHALKIEAGKKDRTVQFPVLNTDGLKWAFLRGFFDGDGSVRSLSAVGFSSPDCSIATYSEKMRRSIQDFVKVPCTNYDKGSLYWSGNNSIDFLSKIYDNANIFLKRKYDMYKIWSTWIPGLTGGAAKEKFDTFRWCKARSDAVAPSKTNASDSGYDLTILEKVKQVGDVEYYDTGVKISPTFGWYFVAVPRSSISKTGYMLANSIGIIDRTYTGSVLVPLRKIDKGAADIKLPAKIIQIIPMPIIHNEFVEVQDLDNTSRNDGGFGSTDGRQ